MCILACREREIINPVVQDDSIQNGVTEDAVNAKTPEDPVLRNSADTPRGVGLHTDKRATRHRAKG